MPGWVLPAAAAAFACGALLLGERVGTRAGLMLALAGATLLVSAVATTGRRRAVPDALVRAGLLPGPADAVDDARAAMRAPLAAGSPERARSQIGPVVRLVALSVGFGLLGGGWAAVRLGAPAPLAAVAERSVAFSGTAAGDVRVYGFGWGLEAAVERVEVGGTPLRVRARVWIRGRGAPPDAAAGERIAGVGIVHAVVRGRSRFEDYLRRRGVTATIDGRSVDVAAGRSAPMLAFANAVRDALRRGSERALGARESGLFLGLTIGDTRSMHPEVEEDFQATGLGHLVAVSGSNVAMFLAPLLGVATLLGAGTVGRVGVGVVGIVFFAAVTRWEPSVLRASVMACLVLFGLLAGRPRSTATLLGAAVLVLLVVDPGLAWSAGFQLSVAATAGIVAFASPLAARMRRVPRPLALAAAATVGAQVGVTPLLLLHFGVVPSSTLVANLLAAPAVAPALFGGVVAAVVALVSAPAGRAVGALADLPIAFLIEVADTMARAPLPSLTGGRTAAVVTGAAVLAALGVRLVARARRAVSVLAAALFIAGLWSAVVRAGPPPVLTAVFFDVGQGDAAVVRTPEGATILVDAGPEEDEVATKLAALGVRRIDLAVATHAHADHLEGFPAVLSRFPVALLIEPGCPADSPSHAELLRAVRDEGVPIRHPRGGDRIAVGSLVVEVLGPDECSSSSSEPNDDSIVIRLRYGTASILLTGDVEHEGQLDLLDDGDPIEAQVLKVPHHGGDTSLPEFFERVGATVAVVSTGENDYGHPVPAVMAALSAAGATVARTDRLGDVAVTFPRGGVAVSPRPDESRFPAPGASPTLPP